MRRTGHPRRRRAGRTAHGPTTCCRRPRRPRPPAPRGPPPAVPSRSPTATSAPPPWGHPGKASGNSGPPQLAAHCSESCPQQPCRGKCIDPGPYEGRPESGTLATFKWKEVPVRFSSPLTPTSAGRRGCGHPDGKRSKPGKMMIPWTLLPGSTTSVYGPYRRIPGADAATFARGGHSAFPAPE